MESFHKMYKRIVKYICSYIERLVTLLREIKRTIRSRQFKKKVSPSIICNNCTGAVILHDLGLPFNTPTVNLYFADPYEFIFLLIT